MASHMPSAAQLIAQYNVKLDVNQQTFAIGYMQSGRDAIAAARCVEPDACDLRLHELAVQHLKNPSVTHFISQAQKLELKESLDTLDIDIVPPTILQKIDLLWRSAKAACQYGKYNAVSTLIESLNKLQGHTTPDLTLTVTGTIDEMREIAQKYIRDY